MNRSILFILAFLLTAVPATAGIDFDVVDDYISLPDNFDDMGSQSVCAWLYVQGAGEGNFGYIFGKTPTSSINGTRFFTDDSSGSNRLVFGKHSSTNGMPQRTSNSDVFLDNTWFHACYTYDGTLNDTGIHIYINASELTYATSNSGTVAVATDAALNAYIGNREGNDRTFNGYISEFAIWTSVLTVEEISLLANSKVKGMPLQVSSSTLVAYYPMDEMPGETSADGDTFVDRKNGYNATGNDGANNTGLTMKSEEVLSYP